MLREDFEEVLDHRLNGIAAESVTSKERERAQLAADVEAFLAAGGQVDRVGSEQGFRYEGFRYGIRLPGTLPPK